MGGSDNECDGGLLGVIANKEVAFPKWNSMSLKLQNKLLFVQRDSHSDNCKQNPFDIVPRNDYDYESSLI